MKMFCKMWAAIVMVVAFLSLAVAQEKPAEKKSASATASGQGIPMAPKPSPEMQKIVKTFAGTWNVTEKYEASDFIPQGGTSSGSDTTRAGPGGFSLIRDYRSKGAMGTYAGHGVIYWNPKENAYKYIWCDSMSAEGCEVGAMGRWEGNDLIFNTEGEFQGKRFKMKLGYTDIKSDSYTFYIDQSTDGGPMKRTMTSNFTKKTVAQAAAAPVKQ